MFPVVLACIPLDVLSYVYVVPPKEALTLAPADPVLVLCPVDVLFS